MAKSKADRLADEKRAAAAERMRKYRASKNKKPAAKKKQVTRVTRQSVQPYQLSDRVQYGLDQVAQAPQAATNTSPQITQFERLNFAAQDVNMKLNIIDNLLVAIGERLFGGIAGDSKSNGASPMPSGHYYQLNNELGNANDKASAIIDKLKGLSEFA